MNYITIDTGTTNTRIRYVEDGKILATYKDKIGVKDTAITGNSDRLKTSIKTGIEECLKSCNKDLEDIDNIIASGMITSGLGLVEIQHLVAPVGVEDLSKAIVVKKFDDIVDKPIYFIPGVKNRVSDNSYHEVSQIDMMRGEEVETIGILDLINTSENVIFISPGSHTKFVFIDETGKILKCSTTLTGELLWALSKETVLADSIPKELISTIDREYIGKGVEAAKEHGFSKACFLVRVLDLFTQARKNQLANFIAGAIGYYDIKSIENDLKDDNIEILIGGNSILRELYGSILELSGYHKSKIHLLDDDMVEKASTIGAIKVVQKYKGR